MKNNKWIASVVATALLSQSIMTYTYADGTVATNPSYSHLVGTLSGDSSLLQAEMKNHQARVDSGAMDARESIEVLANSVAEKNITLADIDAYVKTTQTTAQYSKFKKALTSSLSGVKTDSLTPKDVGEILALATVNAKNEGLAWSGCGGLGGGVVLVVAAVVVGIIAIVKSRGEAKIRRVYADKRAERTEAYNRTIFEYNNKVASLQADIQKYQGYITLNNQRIAELNGMILGATASAGCASDPQCMANVQAWSQEIQNRNEENASYTNRINELNLSLATWQNPGYLDAQIALATQNYQSDMAQYNSQEAADIAMVPQNKSLARKLGIGAAIGGAVGIYFIIDGAQDC